MTLHALLILLCLALLGSAWSLKVNIRGVEVEQFMDYTHVDSHRVANEFDLIDPSRITYAWEREQEIGDSSTGQRQRKTLEGLDPSTNYSLQAAPPGGNYAIVNREIVTIEVWSSNPNESDWIGAYSPADVDITKTSPVRWAWG